MERLGIAADVSHLNHAGFWDVIESGSPVIASHSNAAAVWQHPRSLNDEQIKALIERKGLMGLSFVKDFLGEKEDSGRQALLRHIMHVLDLGGENILAIGSDFDGATMHAELNGIQYVLPLYQYLADQGLNEQVLDKMFYLNAYNYFYER
jgi:membrane dipeptidase